jgi:hypothetical protein
MRRFRCAAALTLVLLTCPRDATAQAGDTVTVTQRVLVGGDVTPAEAKRQAVERALAEAVRRVSGVRVQAAQLGVGDDRDGRVNDSFLSVVQLDAAGRATDYRILDERFHTEHHPTLGAQLYLELRALVTVAREHGAIDPGFKVSVALNDALFFDGGGSIEGNDELIATITPTQDAWLTVFGVVGDSAQVLLPNALMSDNRAVGAKPTELPSREWRDRGVHFRASLPPAEKARRELVVVVATRKPVHFATSTQTGDAMSFPMMDIQKWLVTIPLDQRAIAFAAYEVRRR